jgi:hypothetical protein
VGRMMKVDTDQLRLNAGVLSEANVERRSSATDAHDLGSRRSSGAFEQFEHYWDRALSTLTSNIGALTDALRTAAAVYERHDAQGAEALQGGARAF